LASAGFVAPMTPGVLAIALAACWWAAWLASAVGVRRRSGSGRPTAFFAAATVALGLAAVYQAERLSGRDLVVVRVGGPLVVGPALGADRAGDVDVGEVARVRAVNGVWSRLALDGGRHGWIETSRVVSLAAPPVD
jgi:hypothetical protein